MKITITLVDHENGSVDVTSDPHMKTLAAMARNRDLTPAAGYALAALAKIIRDSQAQTQEQVKAKYDSGLIPAMPSDRKIFG